MPIRVHLAHRAPGQFRSIEELFVTIGAAFPGHVKSAVATAPRVNANPKSLIANWLWATSLSDCDVVHQTGDIHYAVLGVWRRPVVLTIHDLRFIEETQGLKRLLFWWWWLYLPCLRANRVTVISEYTKERLLETCRVNPAKVRVIPNCVGAEFTPMSRAWPLGKVRVLLVGTTENKNLARVIEACAGLDVRLCILGRLSGAQQAQLRDLGVEHETHQSLSRKEVVELYQSCDLVCFVSTYEGFGMPILEGQAVGKPVLTSNIAPMDAVAGGGALLVDPFDVNAIRGGLVQLLEDPALREELVKRGAENVKAYSAKSVAAQYAALYREVVDAR